jgi:hypothetical protein
VGARAWWKSVGDLAGRTLVEILQELPEREAEDFAESEHGAQANVFLAEFKRRSERPGHARFVGERLLTPAFLLPELAYACAEFSAKLDLILHLPLTSR